MPSEWKPPSDEAKARAREALGDVDLPARLSEAGERTPETEEAAG